MESFEYRGFWWLPENPDNKISGFLTFSPKSEAKLELIGVFKPGFNNNPYFHSIILGQTASGKIITLQNCKRTNYTSVDFIYETSDYSSQIVYIGIPANDKINLKFNKIRTRFTYLYDWVGVTGIRPDYTPEKGIKDAQFTYLKPDVISIPINGGKIEFCFTAKLKAHYNIASFNENTFIS